VFSDLISVIQAQLYRAPLDLTVDVRFPKWTLVFSPESQPETNSGVHFLRLICRGTVPP
jgi:hypothetical protein